MKRGTIDVFALPGQSLVSTDTEESQKRQRVTAAGAATNEPACPRAFQDAKAFQQAFGAALDAHTQAHEFALAPADGPMPLKGLRELPPRSKSRQLPLHAGTWIDSAYHVPLSVLRTVLGDDFPNHELFRALRVVPREGQLTKNELGYTVSQEGQPFNMWSINARDPSVLDLPIYWGLSLLGRPEHDKRLAGAPMKYTYRFRHGMRPYQPAAIARVLKTMKRYRGAMLLADCGLGKTYMMLQVVIRLKRRAALLVPSALVAQVVEEVSTTLLAYDPVTGAEVPVSVHGWKGASQAPALDSTHDITVIGVETLRRYNGTPLRFHQYGTLAVDECDGVATELMVQQCRRFPAVFRYSATATPHRNDATGHCVPWELGPVATHLAHEVLLQFAETVKYVPDVQLNIMKSAAAVPEPLLRAAKIHERFLVLARTPAFLAETLYLYEAARTAGKKECLIVTQHLAHLRLLWLMFAVYTRTRVAEVPYVYGAMPKKKRGPQLAAVGERGFMVASLDCVQVGLNRPTFDALIAPFGTSRPQQCFGRVERYVDGKGTAMVYVPQQRGRVQAHRTAIAKQIAYAHSRAYIRVHREHAAPEPTEAMLEAAKAAIAAFDAEMQAYAEQRKAGPKRSSGKRDEMPWSHTMPIPAALFDVWKEPRLAWLLGG
jgi:superfamily II DNA or RNA helicase